MSRKTQRNKIPLKDSWKLPAAANKNSLSTTRNERRKDEGNSTEMESTTHTPQTTGYK